MADAKNCEKDYEKDVEFMEKEMFEPDKTVDDTRFFKAGKLSSRKFYKTKGITADTLKSVANANNDLINSTIKFATKKLTEEEDNDINRIFATIYTDMGKIQGRVSRRKKLVKNPKTGESSTKLTSITAVSIIKSSLDKNLLKQCEDSVIKSVKL